MKQLIPLFLGLLLLGCTSQEKKTDDSAQRLEVSYAKNFRFVKHNGFTELQLIQPEDGKVEISYALVKRGEKVNVPSGMTCVEVPLKRIAALSTTHIGMLSALDKLDILAGTTSRKYVSNAYVSERIQKGVVIDYSDETSITPASLVHNKIEFVIYSGFGGQFPNTAKLAKLGVFTMANYDWRENHPLGKAEWIKVFGYLTGKEKEAEKYFKTVEKQYKVLKKSLAANPSNAKVMVGSLIGDIWYAPAGESYMAEILRDAGADYCYKNEEGTGSCQNSFAQVLRDQHDCPIWINPGAVSLSDLLAQNGKYGLFTAVREERVFCYTHNSNYFWEMSAVNPHWILSDFSKIVNEKDPSGLHFYKRLN